MRLDDLALADLTAAVERVVAILTHNRSALDAGARLLQEQESLTSSQLPVVTPLP